MSTEEIGIQRICSLQHFSEQTTLWSAKGLHLGCPKIKSFQKQDEMEGLKIARVGIGYFIPKKA